ncbi:MAG TPA: type II secretion system protein GspL, partial [Casimicrobiaceae bacterium]|nr:type II secretion system protein GspL [Casimicrobiaceae bacterium]
PDRWPTADRREAVLAADAVRMIALTLPPLPRDRLAAAVHYALEERLATTETAIAIAERRGDGRVPVIVLARDLADALDEGSFTRAVAEPDLAPPAEGWRWCEAPEGGFVRTDEGSAFAVGAMHDDALPTELRLALNEAVANDRAPEAVIVDGARSDAGRLARWQHESGVGFVAGKPWSWSSAAPAQFACAMDIVTGLKRATVTPVVASPRRFTPALAVLALAIILHVVATLGDWLWHRQALGRAQRDAVALANEIGARETDATTAFASIARVHADARHRAGLFASNDAMSMLAQAAPALALLPANALKTATWSGGAWTLDLAPLDEASTQRFVQGLAATGLSALTAKTAAGTRARIPGGPS